MQNTHLRRHKIEQWNGEGCLTLRFAPHQTEEKKEEGLKWGGWVDVSLGFLSWLVLLGEPYIYHDSGVFYNVWGYLRGGLSDLWRISGDYPLGNDAERKLSKREVLLSGECNSTQIVWYSRIPFCPCYTIWRSEDGSGITHRHIDAVSVGHSIEIF